MTEVAFHTGLADKIGYACRLLRKASRHGLRVRVVGDAAELSLLDTALWTFEPLEFLPHLLFTEGGSVPAAASRTSIWLTADPLSWPVGVGAPQVLVNLGLDAPADASTYEKVVELVSDDSEDQASGRQRWRQYKAAGLAPELKTPAAGR